MLSCFLQKYTVSGWLHYSSQNWNTTQQIVERVNVQAEMFISRQTDKSGLHMHLTVKKEDQETGNSFTCNVSRLHV